MRARFLVVVMALLPLDAAALDKQGSAHGGSSEGSDTGFNVTGAFLLGSALYNPTYAARPDNTGHALMRYAAHLDVDLIGRRLSVPLDVNVFTDRDREGFAKLAPTELDVIGGVTSTWDVPLDLGAVELGARGELDRPVDKGRFQQTYVDARARYLYSLGTLVPRVKQLLVDGDVSGWLTLGWFALNPSYAARPDNSGLALFRYGAHTEVSVVQDFFSFAVDGTMFTDRTARNPLRPSELDLTLEYIGRWDPMELHVAYEEDRPIDRPGLVQRFIYCVLVFGFDVGNIRNFLVQRRPFGSRAQVASP